jgi:hypothetical protein
MAVGNEAGDQVDQKVDGAAMARMLDLRDVFELISDGLDDGAFAEQELVGPVEQPIVHLFAQFGDELKPLGHQQLLGEWLREIAFIAKELAHQTCGQLRNRMPIIDIAWGQAKGQDLALIVDDQVQLEAKEPADRGLAASSTASKHAMLVDACIVANSEWSGVDEADASTMAQLCVQIGYQWNQHGGHQRMRSADSSPRWETRHTNGAARIQCNTL